MINIAELLKDCPIGMELDCTNYDGFVKFDGFNENNPFVIRIIVLHDGVVNIHSLTEYGQTNITPYNKCVIFPKGKTTWENFHRPFVDGDILVHTQNERNVISIYKSELLDTDDFKLILCHAILWDKDEGLSVEKPGIACYDDCVRFANEKEIETLFAELKAHGYEWDCNNKVMKCNEKFDESKFVAYETRVLVRDLECDKWIPTIYGYKEVSTLPYVTLSGYYKYCIPYKGNEHLMGKADDCSDYYKTWERWR